MAEYLRTLEGLGDLAAKAAPKPNWPEHEQERISSRNERKAQSWDFNVGFEGAMELAKHGWPEGTAKAKKLLDKIEVPLLETCSPDTRHDVQGSYVDVGAYMQGEPECMVEFTEDSHVARFARIQVNGVMSAGITADEAMRRGVGMVAIVDALESRGVRCDIELVFRNGIEGNVLQYTLPLKHASEPLNLDVISFALAHPACFRRLVFGVMEHEPEDIRRKFNIPGGYGRVTQLPKSEGVLIFEGMSYGEDWGPEGCRKRIDAALKQFTDGGTK